jgi:molecular chaperone GrpE
MELLKGARMEEDTENRSGQNPLQNEVIFEEVTAPVVDEQKKAFNELKASYDELNERFLRLAADFENYKKRVARDEENRIKFANERFAVEVLAVVDNLDRALKADNAHLRAGTETIGQLFRKILERQGITPLESLGRKFDPAEHEALVLVRSEQEDGVVIEEIVRGYRMHNKVIRHAKVAVSKGTTDDGDGKREGSGN